MKQEGADAILSDWARLTADSRPPARARVSVRGQNAVPAGVLALLLVSIVLVSLLAGSPGNPPAGSATSPSSPGTSQATPSSPSGTATSSPQPETSSSTSPPSTATPLPLDAGSALQVATTYEQARAGSDWEAAWALLSPFSQAVFGSLDGFAAAQRNYNDAGGSRFEMGEPTRDPDLLDPAFLGEPFADLQARADLTRAYVVFVQHPDVRGASAGSVGLVVAPLLDGNDWRIWIVH